MFDFFIDLYTSGEFWAGAVTVALIFAIWYVINNLDDSDQ